MIDLEIFLYHAGFQAFNKMWCFTFWCSLQPPEESSFLAGIFAGTKITPDVLVQTLKLEEQPHVSASPTPGQKGKICYEIDWQTHSLCDRWELLFHDLGDITWFDYVKM